MRGNDSESAGRDSASYAAGALARTRFGKMRVHDAPAAGFLAEHHGRAGDELVAAVVDVLGRRRGAGPIAFGAAMAPNHRHVVGHDAAEVERRPVARLHVLPVEFPQPDPMLASVVGVPIEVEEQRLGRCAPDRLELLQIEAGVGVDVVGVQLQDLLAVALGTADEVGFRHCLSNSKLATMGIQPSHTTMSRPRVPGCGVLASFGQNGRRLSRRLASFGQNGPSPVSRVAFVWPKSRDGFVWPKWYFSLVPSTRIFCLMHTS